MNKKIFLIASNVFGPYTNYKGHEIVCSVVQMSSSVSDCCPRAY